MERLKEKVNSFLRKYKMDFESIDIDHNCSLFIAEMENGLEGKRSSLRMIPTYISVRNEFPFEEPVIVIDAGGTNFRVAVVHFTASKKSVIEDFKVYPMPGIKEEITKEAFFRTIAQYLEPVLNKSNKIGFCFSYPTEILPNRDGRLLRFCKEIKAKAVEGEIIGKTLLKIIKSQGLSSEKKVVLLNDTVATLLGGRASQPERVFDSYIGFILGTGTNSCYIEENRHIKKLDYSQVNSGLMLVNIESGAYDRAPRGRIDLEFDSTTVNPGEYIFEKMISGGYLGGLILSILKKAAEEGLFSEQFAGRIQSVDDLESKEIDEFLDYPYSNRNKLANCCLNGQPGEMSADCITLYHIIDATLERAAKLASVNLAAIIFKTGRGRNPCSPICIAAEGTMFYKSKLLRTKIEYHLKTYLNESKGIYFEFVKVENATLIGTAIAGLTN